MTSYYDPQSRTRKSAVYTWTDISALTWADLDSWELADGNQYTLGTQTLVFLTEVIDHGKVEAVNPLCTVSANNTVNIKVYASDTFDSSSQISGSPAIVGGQNTTLNGVSGRYFQFQIEVEDTATALAEISGIEYNIEPRLQQETISGDSATHGGSITQRIAPIVKTYSKLLSVNGNMVNETGKVGFVTVGSLGEPTQPRYTVWSVGTEVTATDSSTGQFIGDSLNNATVNTTSGSPQSQPEVYKWQPYAVQFNSLLDSSTVTDSNDAIDFIIPGLGPADLGGGDTGDFTIDGWFKIPALNATNTSDPQYLHSDYFLEFKWSDESPGELRIRSVTDSGKIKFQFYYNGTWSDIGSSHTAVSDEGDWHYIQIVRSNDFYPTTLNQLYISINNQATRTNVVSAFNHDLSESNSPQLKLGDLSGSGHLYVDDIRVSSTTRSTAVPGAEFVADADTTFLMNGVATETYYSSEFTLQRVDADVNLVITGLPKMVSDADGNIIEGTT